MNGPVALEAERLIPDRVLDLVPVDVFHDDESRIPGPRIDRMVASFLEMVKHPTGKNVGSLFFNEADPSLIDRVPGDWSSAKNSSRRES